MTKVNFFSFPRAFYVINGIELLERGAYYSMNLALTVYLLTTLALTPGQVGLIASILFLLLYLTPIVGAALAEKFGYKSALVASFVLLSAGYALVLFARDFPSALAAVTFVGLGAGIFKPIAAAAVSQTSTEDQRNYAFMIYYGAINLGATIFPLLVGIVGLLARDLLSITAFGVAIILSVVNLVLVATVWKNINPPQREKSVLKHFAGLAEVFRHPKFLILLVIYSGFWFLYAMSLSFVAAYMVEFSRMPLWFNIGFLAVVNPLVIVILAPIMGFFTRGAGSITLMIVGISLYVVGFVVLGFTSLPVFFLGGIVLYSIGEVLTHPSFLAYVSKIAPPDKVSIFLGYGFLPIAVGLFFGASVGGVLYGRFARDAGQPAMFWAIMSAVALVTVAALLVYDHFTKPRAVKPVAPGPAEPRRRGFGAAGAFGAAAVAILMVPALIVAAGAMPGAQPIEAANTDGDGLATSDLVTIDLAEEQGTAEEGAEPVEIAITLPENATGAALFTLSWTDELPGPGETNAPDVFKLHVMRPDGSVLESEEEADGTIELTVPNATPGVYVVHVELVEAGDRSVLVTPLGQSLGGGADSANDFTLGARHQASA